MGKDASGQGFRSLHLFNVALLGKIRWQLLYGLESLVCRVLKVRYFPSSNFYEARLGGNPSYTWTSILAS